MSFGWRWWIGPSIETYVEASRRLLLSVALGFTVVWPMFRLSLRGAPAARLSPALDWLALFGTFQVLLWPLRLPTQWSASQLILLDLTIWCWGLLYASLIAMGLGGTAPRRRTAVMLACLVLTFGAPLVAMLTGRPGMAMIGKDAPPAEWLYWSPLTAVWTLGGRTVRTIERPDWMRVAILGTAAALAWLAAFLQPRTSARVKP